MIRCQSAGASVSESATWPAPALLTSTSRRPKASSARSTSAAGPSASVSSTATPSAVPPPRSIAAAVARARSGEREVTTTRHAAAGQLAPRSARPMPEEDPVTMATRPASGRVPSSGIISAA